MAAMRNPAGESAKTTENAVYVLRNDVAVEDFEDGSIVFQAADRRLVNVNAVTRRILVLLDGKRTLADVSEALAKECEEPEEKIIADVLEIVAQLTAQRVLKARVRMPLKMENVSMNETAKYLANPDVSCRIEDDDGAILYNPDTSGVQVINPIALEIWETLSSPNTRAGLVSHLKEVCEGVPEDQVQKDVDEFLNKLLAGGFVGEIAENNPAGNRMGRQESVEGEETSDGSMHRRSLHQDR